MDQNGEWFWLVPIIGAAIFGVGNVVAHAIKGDIDNVGDALKYFGQGALVGAALGVAWQLAPLIPYIGQAVQTTMTWYGYSQLAIGGLGMIGGAINGGWNGLANGAKAFLGNFYLDENNWFGGAANGFLRHTWEIPQSLIGHGYTQVRNSFGSVDRVDYFGGATFATNELSGDRDGVSMGNYININIDDRIEGSFVERVTSDPLYMHEYGHTFDSRIFGLSYLFVIGVPSGISAATSKPIGGGLSTHDYRWYEMRANRHAARYFGKRYGVNWMDFLTYPRKR